MSVLVGLARRVGGEDGAGEARNMRSGLDRGVSSDPFVSCVGGLVGGSFMNDLVN